MQMPSAQVQPAARTTIGDVPDSSAEPSAQCGDTLARAVADGLIRKHMRGHTIVDAALVNVDAGFLAGEDAD